MNNLALVIEDDADLATIFAGALQAAGFAVETIRDGAQAVTRLTETIPHVVVLDLHLPHVPGQEILARMRADGRLNATRVILATADARLADEMEGQADLVLLKPVSFGQLRDLALRLKSSLPTGKQDESARATD